MALATINLCNLYNFSEGIKLKQIKALKKISSIQIKALKNISSIQINDVMAL